MQDRTNNAGKASPRWNVPMLLVMVLGATILGNLLLFALILLGVITLPTPQVSPAP